MKTLLKAKKYKILDRFKLTKTNKILKIKTRINQLYMNRVFKKIGCERHNTKITTLISVVRIENKNTFSRNKNL